MHQGAAIMLRENKSPLGAEGVRLDGDVVRMARIIAAASTEERILIGKYLSDILRPVLIDRVRAIEAEGLLPKTPKKKP